MFLFKTKILSIGIFLLALLVFIFGTIGIINYDLALMISGFLGFSGIAAFRTYIESHGWKTYVLAVGGVISILFVSFGVLPADKLTLLITLFSSLAGITLVEGYSKDIAQRNPLKKE